MNALTISNLQAYIKTKDNRIDFKQGYFMKLVEELGELSEVMRNDENRKMATTNDIKGTIEEELWDIIYYTLVLANLYDIDLEHWIIVKDKLASKKYKQNTDLLKFIETYRKNS